MPALIEIKFCLPSGYREGDYAMLYSNGGEGEIDFDTPVIGDRFDLFPGRAGIFGFGHAPWGHFRWGYAHSMRTMGFGHLPWGHFPWGHGSIEVIAKVFVSACGDYKFAFGCFDAAGNFHEGTPAEVELEVHTAPDPPTGLKKGSYDKVTDVLTLEVA